MKANIHGLTLLHKLAAGVLLFFGVCLFFNPKAYTQTYEGRFASAEYPFLQAGDYSLEITYEGADKGCQVIVETKALVAEDNTQGIIFLEEPIEEGYGTAQIIVHIPESAEAVTVRNSMGDGEDAEIFHKIVLQSVQLLDKDNYFLSGLCFLAAIGVLLLGLFIPKEKYLMPVVLTGIALLASLPLMNDFLKWGHDLNFHLARLEGIYQGLRSGAFPVIINPFQLEGFGYLTGAMYPQLFLYPFAALRFFGISTVLCYKLLLISANITTVFLTYYSVKTICKSIPTGLTASILYTFSIYRLADMYTRGAVGELWAMAFLPLIVWGIYELLWGNYRKWYLLALGVSGVLQSHVLSVEMSLVFLIATGLCWLVMKGKTDWLKRILAGLKAVLFTILLNAFFLIPFLYYGNEQLQVFHINNDLSLSAAYFSQMFPFFPEATGSNKISGYTQGEMPIAIGGILLAGAVLFCAAIFKKKKEEQTTSDKLGLLCLIFGIFSMVLSSWLFPWETIQSVPALNFLAAPLEFVWRYLGPASMFLSVAGAVGIVSFAQKRQWIYGAVFAVLLCSTGYYFDQFSLHVEDLPNKMLIAGVDNPADNSYLYDESDISDFSRTDSTIRCTGDSVVTYSGYRKSGTNITVNTSVSKYAEGSNLLFPLYGYTGYEVRVNGEKVEMHREESRVACALPKEDALIEIAYTGLPSFHIADWVSGITLLASVVCFIAKQLKGKNAVPGAAAP